MHKFHLRKLTFIFLLFFPLSIAIFSSEYAFAATNEIYGRIWYERGGSIISYDSGIDTPAIGTTITAVCSGYANRTTTVDATGSFNLGQMPLTTCTATVRLPDGRTTSQSKSFQANGGCSNTPNNCGNLIMNVGFPPPAAPTATPTPSQVVYTIAGSVYSDTNKNGYKDNGEANYNGTPSITASRGTVTNNTDGTFTISNLAAGTVTISYTSLPPGYAITYPLNGPPASFQVTVGPGCDTNGARGASCQ